MGLEIQQIAPNFINVTGDGWIVWFSYETPIAFNNGITRIICTNQWTKTTGKHLNIISSDKKNRLEPGPFFKAYKEFCDKRGL